MYLNILLCVCFMSPLLFYLLPFIWRLSPKTCVSWQQMSPNCFLASDRENISIFLFLSPPSNCYTNNLASLMLLRSTIAETKWQFHSHSDIQKVIGWYKLISSKHMHMGGILKMDLKSVTKYKWYMSFLCFLQSFSCRLFRFRDDIKV